MQAMGTIIQTYEPDFICLQEVTPDIMKELTNQQWSKAYYCSDPEANLVSRYGNCILSKYKFHEFMQRELESNMGRKLMLGTVVVQNSPQLCLGTFHLESDSKDVEIRATQLEEFRNSVSDFHYCIFVRRHKFRLRRGSSDIRTEIYRLMGSIAPR